MKEIQKIFLFQYRDKSFNLDYGIQNDRKLPLSLSLSEETVKLPKFFKEKKKQILFLFFPFLTFSSNFVAGRLRKRRQGYLGQWIRILDVVHSHVHRSWQRLAISIHCLRKWRWSVSNTLHHRSFSRWETVLLS